MLNYITTVFMKGHYLQVLLIVMIIYSMSAYSQGMKEELSIANDLVAALTLQGIDCDGISELEQSNGDGYDVVCEDGGNYSVSQSKNGFLNVVDNLTGIMRKGLGTLVGVVPFTGQIFQMKGEVTEHDAEVARSLFSIIELSDNVCEAITGYVTNTSDEHIVSCASGQSYRVYTTADGLVVVEVVSA